MSRRRVIGCLFTWIRLRPTARSAASVSVVRSSSMSSARTIASSWPAATRAASGTPRNDRPVATHATASSRLVLPCPLAPVITVHPSPNATSSVS
jgi:hypothetical protein